MVLPTSDPALKARIVERGCALPEAIGAVLFPRMVAWDRQNMERALSALRLPTLVIQSSYLNTERVRVPLEPGETTPWLDLVRARIPDVRVEVIIGVGHFPQIEAADAVNRVIGAFVDAV
jgi:pimeloyl-ACP methyl ester carboxylesterase